MPITFNSGDKILRDISLTPISVGGLISRIFIGTNSWPWDTSAEDRAYIELQNLGNNTISGTAYLYDWQEWWGDPPGNDRMMRKVGFTVAPSGIFRFSKGFSHVKFDNTYIRLEVVVDNVIVLSTPYIYYIPGKQYIGGTEEAVGECTYTAPGLAVLWYGQNRSSCSSWNGSYKTPPEVSLTDADHWARFDYDTWDGRAWNAVFLCVLDAGFIPRAEYRCHISGGPHWKSAYFNFTAK